MEPPQPSKDEKRSLLSIFHEFANDTTIHGMKEISKYWSRVPMRYFFIVCQIACWIVMIYHGYLVMSQFLSQPTLIQTVTMTERSYPYPALTFCPQLWLNVTKYEELGITKAALLYAVSFLKRVKINDTVDLAVGEQELKMFMAEKNFTSYFDLYLTLANDYTNESLYCEECTVWPPKKVVTEEGVCYYMTFHDCETTILVNRQPKITYTPATYDNNTKDLSILDSFYTIDLSEYVAIGGDENDFSNLQPIFVVLNQSYFFQITPMKQISVNDEFTPCDEYRPNESTLMCRAYCHQEAANRKCGLPKLLGYFRGSKIAGPNTTIGLWSSLNQTRAEFYQDAIACYAKTQAEVYECEFKACPPKCEEMTYSTAIQTIATRRILDELDEAALTMIVSYQVLAGVVVVLEVNSYTWYTFLSDVGGLIGLWCGASVVSVIPIVTFFSHELANLYCKNVKKKMAVKIRPIVVSTKSNGQSTHAGNPDVLKH